MKRFLIAAFAVAFSVSTAQAQGQNCGNRELVIERLAEGYGESRQSIGLASQNRAVEVFANLQTGTWTITVTLPHGVMCLVASGQAYEAIAETPAPSGDSL